MVEASKPSKFHPEAHICVTARCSAFMSQQNQRIYVTARRSALTSQSRHEVVYVTARHSRHSKTRSGLRHSETQRIDVSDKTRSSLRHSEALTSQRGTHVTAKHVVHPGGKSALKRPFLKT
eukprot:1136181-Pelagomonas_calceolata.AAC.1